MARLRLGFVLAALAVGCGEFYESRVAADDNQLEKLRAARLPLNERGIPRNSPAAGE